MEPRNHIGMDTQGYVGMSPQDHSYKNDSEIMAAWLHSPGRCCMVGSCIRSSADSTLSASLTNSHLLAARLSSLLASMLVGMVPARLSDTLSVHSIGTNSSPGHSLGVPLIGSHSSDPLAGRLAS
jgi:hypothetical protein